MNIVVREHNGNTIALLLVTPNVTEDDSLRITYAHATEIGEGESGRETREPRRDWLRLTQSTFYTLSKADASALHALLPVLGDAYVGVPVWFDRLTGATWANRAHTAGFIVRLSDGVIFAADAELTAGVEYAPLLVGKFKNLPEIEAWTLDSGEGECVVVEDSPAEYRVVPNAVVATNEFPAALVPRWTRVLNRAEDGREYSAIGEGRERAIEGKEKAFRWGQEADFLLRTRAEVRTLLGFFAATRGRWVSFTAPWWFQPSDDAPETPHATKARFASDEITLSFGGDTADVSLALMQVPWEVEPPAGETAQQPARAYLYRYLCDVPGGPLVWRFTDYERSITVMEDGQPVTYFPAKMAHDKLNQDYMLGDEATKLTSTVAESHPWMLVLRSWLEAPLAIDVFATDPAEPNADELVYSGEIDDVRGKGRKLTASTLVLGGMLETKVPNFFLQVPCNHDFCSEWCQLAEEAWTFAGTLVSVDGLTVTLDVTSNPPAAVLSADWFANGWICKGSGASYEVREISRSVAGAGDRQTFTLSKPFRALDAGEVFTFQPNCGGTWEECKNKFGNQINYGGHRLQPGDNPSLPARTTQTQGGKK